MGQMSARDRPLGGYHFDLLGIGVIWGGHEEWCGLHLLFWSRKDALVLAIVFCWANCHRTAESKPNPGEILSTFLEGMKVKYYTEQLYQVALAFKLLKDYGL